MPKKKFTKRAGKVPADVKHIAVDLRPLAVVVSDLKRLVKNPRSHSTEDVAAIAASLNRFGQRTPLVVNRRGGQILKGNGTYAAAQKLGWSKLAVVWVTDDEQTATGYAIADNRTAELSRWDDAVLLELLPAVQNSDGDLFTALMLDELQVEAGDIEPLTVLKPPAMSWVLIGIATNKFGSISNTIETLAEVEEITIETTVTS